METPARLFDAWVQRWEDGWDADVIAEDHHMFIKCMFGSYWEEIFAEYEAAGHPSRFESSRSPTWTW